MPLVLPHQPRTSMLNLVATKMPLLALFVLLSLSLGGCGVASLVSSPPWQFRGDSSDYHQTAGGVVPKEFLTEANEDFSSIMASYQSGVYASSSGNRLGFTLNHWTPIPDGIPHGFSIRSYFDPSVRLREIQEEYAGIVARSSTLPASQRARGDIPPSPDNEWKAGYYMPKFTGDLEKPIACTENVNGFDTHKRYGFIWENDFQTSHRDIGVEGNEISFGFYWRRYAQVPSDVAISGKLEGNASVFIRYGPHREILSIYLTEVWGAAAVN